MKRALVLFLSLLIFLFPAALACADDANDLPWITGDLLTVNGDEPALFLEAPSPDAVALARVLPGESVYFVSVIDESYSLVYYGGRYGYAANDALTYSGRTVRYVTGCGDGLPLREDASSESELLQLLPRGAMVYAAQIAGSEFSRVAVGARSEAPDFRQLAGGSNAESGYALTEALTITPFEPGDMLTVVRANAPVRLYDSPSVMGTILAELPAGTAVSVESSGLNGFTRVHIGGIRGYVLSGYLSQPVSSAQYAR